MLFASALAGAALLVYAPVRRRRTGAPGLGETLSHHALIPAALRGYAAWAEGAEGLIGVVVLAGWTLGSEPLLRSGGAAMAALYALFAVYLAVLLRRRGRVPCGCLDASGTVTGVSIARAVFLCAAGTLVALGTFTPVAGLLPRLAHLPAGVFVAALLVIAGKIAELPGTSGFPVGYGQKNGVRGG
ncbi:MauE/DoxX family redox-associated membrane protein [Streptosporangium sp. NPDC000396]|uniref:MauE/DoxX family redox-associated membrane protein n=1 Tax=Streptosporangium sp. NPDC000396 TaxID=3366185 RepID=UPI003689DEBC